MGGMLEHQLPFEWTIISFFPKRNYDPTPRQTRQNPYDQRAPNPYDQRGDSYDQRNNIELSQVNNSNRFNGPADDNTAFYDEVGIVAPCVTVFTPNIHSSRSS